MRYLLVFIMIFVPMFLAAQDSSNVSLISNLYNFWGFTEDVEISGDYAFMPDAFFGLRVIDVSDPANLTTETFPEISSSKQLAISEDMLYATDYMGNMLAVDISNPLAPELLGSCSVGEDIGDIVVEGDYAYIADNDIGMAIVNVSDPSDPFIAGTFETIEGGQSVEIDGDVAYLGADNSDDLFVIDVSIPAMPYQIGIADAHHPPEDLTIYGNLLFSASDNEGLYIFNVSTPSNIAELGSYTNVDEVVGVEVSGIYAYLTDEQSGLYVIDISIPSSPTLEANLDVGDSFTGIAIQGNTAFITGESSALHIVDIQTPGDPEELACIGSTGFLFKIDYQDDYAYLIDQNGILLIIDVSDPYNPVETGRTEDLGMLFDVDVQGDFAYLADEGGGVWKVDITNPVSPLTVGLYETDYSALAVHAEGNIVYIGERMDDDGRLEIIDFSTVPAVQLGYTAMDRGEWMAFENGYIFVAAEDAGVQIFNVSNPANPVLAGSFATASNCYAVAAQGNYVYSASMEAGLEIIDVSDPSDPSQVSTYDTGGYAGSVSVSGGYVYVGDWYGGFRVINVENPAAPYGVGYYQASAMDMAVGGDIVYAAGAFTMNVFDCSQALFIGEFEIPAAPGEYRLNNAYPNPFNAQTTIGFTLPHAGEVTLSVYDITGREIQSLATGHWSLGYHEVVWDAEGCSSGVYFVRLELQSAGTLQRTSVRKVVLVK